MLSAFWSGVGGKLAEQWGARLLTPALLFWATGGLAWSWAQRPASARGQSITTSLSDALRQRALEFDRLSGAEQIAWLIAALLAVAGSAVVVERLTAPFLRLLEGYWPGGRPRWLWRLLTKIALWRRRKLREQWGRLRRLPSPMPQGRTAEGVLAARLHGLPPAEFAMPTALGNILRASELRSARRYGLDPVVTWPRLWLLLPDLTRAEIAGSRGRLDAAGRGVLWLVLTAVWAVFAWWIAVAAVLLAIALYRSAALPAARVYADLVEAAFDLHRPALYQALRLRPPAEPAGEPASGRQLTTYLWEGYAPATVTFDETMTSSTTPGS
jgi:hypothetical protein